MATITNGNSNNTLETSNNVQSSSVSSSMQRQPQQQSCLPLTANNLLHICTLPRRRFSNKQQRQKDEKERLATLLQWKNNSPCLLGTLLFSSNIKSKNKKKKNETARGQEGKRSITIESKVAETTAAVDSKSGCYPLHWAAGTGFNQCVKFILDFYSELYHSRDNNNNQHDNDHQHDDYNSITPCSTYNDGGTNNTTTSIVNQRAYLPSLGRTPLHYAARNGYKSTCQLLIEVYGASRNPKCSKGSVTPLQLAVWQNHLHVVQYLVKVLLLETQQPQQMSPPPQDDKKDFQGNHDNNNNHQYRHDIIFEKNDFQCGLMHWIGLVPSKRWCGDNDDDDDDDDDDDSKNKYQKLSALKQQQQKEQEQSTQKVSEIKYNGPHPQCKEQQQQQQQNVEINQDSLTMKISTITDNNYNNTGIENHEDCDKDNNTNTNNKNDGNDDDGSGVLPLAKYLHSLGISYQSTFDNANSQGHTPLHKAAYGGNLKFVQYLIKEHHIYDNKQDRCGNYGTDLARMQGHTHIQHYLWQHGSYETYHSYQILGLLPPPSEEQQQQYSRTKAITKEDIKQRYTTLIRQYHPDKQHTRRQQQEQQKKADGLVQNTEHAVSTYTSSSTKITVSDHFLVIQEAYDHLMKRDGIGSQNNPKHCERKLLTMEVETKKKKQSISNSSDKGQVYAGGTRLEEEEDDDDKLSSFLSTQDDGDDDCFNARLLTVISDYGDKGFPISNISKRWNQIWPHKPFPLPHNYVIDIHVVCNQTKELITIRKKVNLLKFLKWKCTGIVKFRKVDGVMLAYKI